MIGVSVQSKSTIKGLERIIDGLPDAVADGLDDVAMLGRTEAQKRSKGSVKKSIVAERDGRNVTLSALAPHAGFVEFGRKAIRAPEGHFLRFVVAGRVIYRPEVGPARPRPFMRPAIQVMNRSNLVEKSIEALIRGT